MVLVGEARAGTDDYGAICEYCFARGKSAATIICGYA